MRALAASGSQRFQYDAANRLVKVKADDNVTVLAGYTYGDSNQRLISDEGALRTYYACDGSAEYTESGNSTVPQWSKTYIYLGDRLLSTLTPNGGGVETIQYHHPDQLGTRLVTDPSNGTSFEQVSLPFGTALKAESTGPTTRRFTSYDRSLTTGLDYAVNRHYDSRQGRFTQVDRIGMGSVSLTSPQTLNLYAYCTNDPVNHTDPSGLGFISWLKKFVKRVIHALVNAAISAAIAFITSGLDPKVFVAVFVAEFLKEMGWPSQGWLPSVRRGTPPTFPTRSIRIPTSEIFAGTILAPLFPSPQDRLRYIIVWNPNGGFGFATGAGPHKSYSRTFFCEKSAKDIFHRLRTHFSKLANFTGAFGLNNEAYAIVTFGAKLITKGATIPIHNVNFPPSPAPPFVFDVAVRVSAVTYGGRASGFRFDTLQGHLLYPATISFWAVQGDQGSVTFTINVAGEFAGLFAHGLYEAGGKDLEDSIWNNLIDNVERYCGHEPPR